MSNTDLIKELRALTSAGMKDCKDALEEAGWDLQKAVDIVKIKGLNIADGRSGKIASEGKVGLWASMDLKTVCMAEINCQTDFVANGEDFAKFGRTVLTALGQSVEDSMPFTVDMVEDARKEVVSKTKENVIVRRWWVEQSLSPTTVKVFFYQHPNAKIGVLLTMAGTVDDCVFNRDFNLLGEDLTMQIAAMNPLAVDLSRIPAEERERQKVIFESQLKEENKPEKMWEKILEGKFRKWSTEVCLLDQESVIAPKTSVRQVIKNVGDKLGGEIQIVNFVRCQVGEGIEKKQDDLAAEVAKMM